MLNTFNAVSTLGSSFLGYSKGVTTFDSSFF